MNPPRDPNQTTDLPPADDPGRTTDLPRGVPPDLPAAPTARRGETSVAPARPPAPDETVEQPTARAPADTGPGPSGPMATTDGDFSVDPPLTLSGKGVPPPRGKRPPDVPGYEILAELGRGGMGVVYKARQTALDRVVALKMVLAGPHASPTTILRFDTEARAVARFQHPNIVQIHEVGTADGLPYFSLEFVDGGPLDKKIGKEAQPPTFAARTAETLARAMQYAHDRGIIHRDLKPANVLVAKDGTPKITDFGLAKSIAEDSGQTQAGSVMGTPSYMAPEQAKGEKVGPAADIYALGATLYDLLTGRPPFAGSSVLDTLEMVRTREPVAPGQLAAKVPRDLETICLKCLHKDPAKRYASAGDLAEDLRRFLDGRPILARPVGTAERTWRWAKRNPWPAAAVALAAAILVGLPVFTWQLSVQKTEAEEQTRQATIAKENEAEERRKADTARAVAEKARDDEKKAREATAQQRNLSLDVMRGFSQTIDDRMRNNRALAPVRLLIFETILRDLDKVRDHAAANPLDDRAEAVAYARMGEVYERANRVADAAAQYRRAYDILARSARDNPADPVGKRNLAAVNNLIGDMELRLGNATAARDRYATGLALRREWVGMVPDHAPAKVAVAQSHGLLGRVYLFLGDPAAALDAYRASEAEYAALPADARSVGVRREVAAVRDRLGEATFRVGRFAEAEALRRDALRDREALLKQSPANPALVRDAALSRMNLADHALFLGRAREAFGEAARAYTAFAALAKADPESLMLAGDLAATHYRLGVLAERLPSAAGPAAGAGLAARHFAECVRLRAELAKADPKDTRGQIDLMLALARAGRGSEAEAIAGGLLKQAGDDRRVLFQAASGLAVAGRGERALGVIEALIARGWKDRVTLETDPDLEAVRCEKRFAELVGRLPAAAGVR